MNYIATNKLHEFLQIAHVWRIFLFLLDSTERDPKQPCTSDLFDANVEIACGESIVTRPDRILCTFPGFNAEYQYKYKFILTVYVKLYL